MSREILVTDPCSFCGERGADTCWPTPQARAAHEACHRQVLPLETTLRNTLQERVSDGFHQSMARIEAMRAVIPRLNGLSFRDFVQQEGSQRLQALFDTVGRAAVVLYAQTMPGAARQP